MLMHIFNCEIKKGVLKELKIGFTKVLTLTALTVHLARNINIL